VFLSRAALCTALLTGVGLLPVLAPPAQAALPPRSRWVSDVSDAMHGSLAYAERRVARGGDRLAVNLDIDNTSLATHYDPGRAVARVLRFARYARSQDVSLLFNTGRLRGDGRMVWVAAVLEREGYAVTAICGRTSASEELSHSKQRCRRRFVRHGYTIVANIGNRSTDFTGGNYERAFRLPSYHDQLG
jgi:hypothetical protein